jgi:hypothetical protein
VRCVQISCPCGVGSVALCTGVRNVRRLKTNKEEEEVGGRSPTLG